jgi:transglutaminase-like putative cysteine protease
MADQSVHPDGFQHKNDPEHSGRSRCWNMGSASHRIVGSGKQFPDRANLIAFFGLSSTEARISMNIKVGYEFIYRFPQATPVILTVSVHDSRAGDVVVPDCLTTDPPVEITDYRDSFGNQCARLVAPAGRVRFAASGVVWDSAAPDAMAPAAAQHDVFDLPPETLVFLLGSRYCETDRLSETAWQLFEHSARGWQRVQAICNFVHNHIVFNYQNARATRTAWEAYNEGTGVCRDYAHLAIAMCRCMNIPARYCTGYLGDVGTLPPYGVGDFAAWFEAWLGGAWHTFDPRNNQPRIGRVLVARGRDAADVAITTTFGQNTLESFRVFTDEI